ncbi:MAG: prepilin peptidase [Betaproteobacteria bacterium]
METWRSALLTGILVVAVVSDVRRRRIPNLLTFPSLAMGLFLGTVEAGWAGLGTSLLGALLGAGLLFLPFALGGIGAGDVKLMAVVGAFGGPSLAVQAFLTGAIFGGVGSAFLLWRAGRLWSTLRTVLWDCVALVAPAMPFLRLPQRSAGEKGGVPTTLPYGVAIALGTLVARFWLAR